MRVADQLRAQHVYNPDRTPELLELARRALARTGHPQVLHYHRAGTSCRGAQHSRLRFAR